MQEGFYPAVPLLCSVAVDVPNKADFKQKPRFQTKTPKLANMGLTFRESKDIGITRQIQTVSQCLYEPLSVNIWSHLWLQLP